MFDTDGGRWVLGYALVLQHVKSRTDDTVHGYNRSHSSRISRITYTWCVQVLRSPEEAFAAAMQSWRERCEKCVCLQGDYVEK